MAPSASPNQLLILDRLVLNEGRRPDIIRTSQPQLAAHTKAPTVRFAFASHRDAMVGARSCVKSVESRYLGCVHEYPRLVLRIAYYVVLRQAVNAEPEGLGINATPRQTFASVRHSNTVMISPVDASDFSMAIQTVDGLRMQYVGEVLSVAFIDASLAEVVRSPAVHDTISMDGEGVIRTSANVNDVFSQADACGDKATVREANVDAAAQLTLPTKSPGVNATLLVKSECMVAPSGDLRDVSQPRYESGSVLDCHVC